ncbi:MAG: hypothetical protein RL070_640 [Bacteroidota bacterium]|jgi:hypothetical protein
MKRIYILILGFCLFIGCNENDDNDNNTKDKYNISNENLNKVNSLIDAFFSDTLNTNIKLEEKEIASIDSVFEIYDKDSIIKALNQYDSSRKEFDLLIKKVSNKRYIFKGDDINCKNDTLLLINYLEIMKKQNDIIDNLYDMKEKRFYGWRVRYSYYAKDTNNSNDTINNYRNKCRDTFIMNPEFNRIISHTSNDWEQDFYLPRKIVMLRSKTVNRELKYARLKQGLPYDD